MGNPANTQTFSNIDAAKWQRIKDAIKAKYGITIETDTGRETKAGVTISWGYTQTQLVITLEHRSFFDPSEEVIDTGIANLVNNA